MLRIPSLPHKFYDALIIILLRSVYFFVYYYIKYYISFTLGLRASSSEYNIRLAFTSPTLFFPNTYTLCLPFFPYTYIYYFLFLLFVYALLTIDRPYYCPVDNSTLYGRYSLPRPRWVIKPTLPFFFPNIRIDP